MSTLDFGPPSDVYATPELYQADKREVTTFEQKRKHIESQIKTLKESIERLSKELRDMAPTQAQYVMMNNVERYEALERLEATFRPRVKDYFPDKTDAWVTAKATLFEESGNYDYDFLFKLAYTAIARKGDPHDELLTSLQEIDDDWFNVRGETLHVLCEDIEQRMRAKRT